jgi:hypothetical protein
LWFGGRRRLDATLWKIRQRNRSLSYYVMYKRNDIWRLTQLANQISCSARLGHWRGGGPHNEGLEWKACFQPGKIAATVERSRDGALVAALVSGLLS